jgi:hypothetical protein
MFRIANANIRTRSKLSSSFNVSFIAVQRITYNSFKRESTNVGAARIGRSSLNLVTRAVQGITYRFRRTCTNVGATRIGRSSLNLVTRAVQGIAYRFGRACTNVGATRISRSSLNLITRAVERFAYRFGRAFTNRRTAVGRISLRSNFSIRTSESACLDVATARTGATISRNSLIENFSIFRTSKCTRIQKEIACTRRATFTIKNISNFTVAITKISTNKRVPTLTRSWTAVPGDENCCITFDAQTFEWVTRTQIAFAIDWATILVRQINRDNTQTPNNQ